MFKSFIAALSIVSVNAWLEKQPYGSHGHGLRGHGLKISGHGLRGHGLRSYGGYGHRHGVEPKQTRPVGFGADNQHYGHQLGKGSVDAHNSHRQSGHQGQGHNQWVDNAWNQWGTNNHWDTQKSVDNKWGNNSGKINVTLNSVSGHYDQDYGQQQRGIGYEGHQNTSGDVGYVIGLGGHSFNYAPGNHSYGYENNADWGYGGWANNLGAWNHGANYDNFGNQHHDGHNRGVANEARDSADVKRVRRVGAGYADFEELEDTDRRDKGDQYGRGRVAALTDLTRGAEHQFGRKGGLSLRGNRGVGVTVQGPRQVNYRKGSYGGTDQGKGLGGGYGGYGGYGHGGHLGGFGFGGFRGGFGGLKGW